MLADVAQIYQFFTTKELRFKYIKLKIASSQRSLAINIFGF